MLSKYTTFPCPINHLATFPPFSGQLQNPIFYPTQLTSWYSDFIDFEELHVHDIPATQAHGYTVILVKTETIPSLKFSA